MRNDLVKRLVEFEFSDNLGNGDFSVCYEAEDRIERLNERILFASGLMEVLDERIEELEKKLSLINNTLNVTLNETMTTSWKEFCKALIEETRELLEEGK